MYYRDTSLAMVVFAMDNAQSLYDVNMWHDEMVKNSGQDVKFLLVGNKSDCSELQVTEEEIAKVANKLKCEYIITSAKTNSNIKEAFQKLADMLNLNALDELTDIEFEDLDTVPADSDSGKCC